MTPIECRASLSLASILALRMLGLFLILPVFSIAARTLTGGEQTLWVGLAIGAYGLTQALFYLPYGMISDHFGRKPVIIFGLIIFALGSLVAALAQDIYWVTFGRIIQGAGAISSVVIALLADLTEESQRTKAMAFVGAAIALSFAIALITAPILFSWLHLSGLFLLIGAFALLAIALVIWVVPNPPAALIQSPKKPASFGRLLREPELLRLNCGVFILHATQTALFVTLPHLLEQMGLPLAVHWKIYLSVLISSVLLMIPAIIIAERYQKMKGVLLSAIILITLAQFLFASDFNSLALIIILLIIYFTGFNILEAIQPSLVSQRAPSHQKGSAMGIYNTTQALGLFFGGLLAGYLLQYYNQQLLFGVFTLIGIIWLMIACKMHVHIR